LQDLEGIREGDARANSAGTLGYEDCWARWREWKNITGCYALECLAAGLWDVEIWGSLKHSAYQSVSGQSRNTNCYRPKTTGAVLPHVESCRFRSPEALAA